MRFPDISILTTSRLRLRKLREEDAPAYYRHLFGSHAVSRYMLWNPHRDISESVASIQKVLRRYEEGHCYRWGITIQETGELIGIIDLLRFDEETESCSFAYMLGEDYWGRGYGTEALKAVFAFAFTEMEIRSITADHMTENPASGRVMEKAGMVRTRFLPAKYEKAAKPTTQSNIPSPRKTGKIPGADTSAPGIRFYAGSLKIFTSMTIAAAASTTSVRNWA